MFKIVENPTFTHDVPVNVPVDDGFEEQTLRCTFRVVDADELNEFDLTTAGGTEAYCRRVCVRFGDIEEEPGRSSPRTPEAMMTFLLSKPYVRMGLVRTYTAAMHGARLGN